MLKNLGNIISGSSMVASVDGNSYVITLNYIRGLDHPLSTMLPEPEAIGTGTGRKQRVVVFPVSDKVCCKPVDDHHAITINHFMHAPLAAGMPGLFSEKSVRQDRSLLASVENQPDDIHSKN